MYKYKLYILYESPSESLLLYQGDSDGEINFRFNLKSVPQPSIKKVLRHYLRHKRTRIIRSDHKIRKINYTITVHISRYIPGRK